MGKETDCEMGGSGVSAKNGSYPSDFPASAAILGKLADVLERLIMSNACRSRNNNDKGGSDKEAISKFQCSYLPDVSILSYLERLRKYSNCSDGCFVVLLIYVDRIIETRKIAVTHLNVHRLILTAVLIASKFHDDVFYNNAFYAKLGGVSAVEMNALEIEFLKMINFSLKVDTASFEKYYRDLVNFEVTWAAPAEPSHQQLLAKTGVLDPRTMRPNVNSPSSVAHGIDVSNYASWPSPGCISNTNSAMYQQQQHYQQQQVSDIGCGVYGIVNNQITRVVDTVYCVVNNGQPGVPRRVLGACADRSSIVYTTPISVFL